MDIGPNYVFHWCNNGKFIYIYKIVGTGDEHIVDLNSPRYWINAANIYVIEEGLPDPEIKFDFDKPITLEL